MVGLSSGWWLDCKVLSEAPFPDETCRRQTSCVAPGDKTLMTFIRIFLALLVSLLALGANAGSKRLAVAFFDYSEDSVGKSSFKSLRTARIEHPCWQHFGEIEGIETAYIENPPKSLDRMGLLAAVRGSLPAARQFAASLRAEHLDGAYAFVPDPTGRYASILGIHYQDGAITSSASFRKPEKGLIDPSALSKALCEASKSMD